MKFEFHRQSSRIELDNENPSRMCQSREIFARRRSALSTLKLSCCVLIFFFFLLFLPLFHFSHCWNAKRGFFRPNSTSDDERLRENLNFFQQLSLTQSFAGDHTHTYNKCATGFLCFCLDTFFSFIIVIIVLLFWFFSSSHSRYACVRWAIIVVVVGHKYVIRWMVWERMWGCLMLLFTNWEREISECVTMCCTGRFQEMSRLFFCQLNFCFFIYLKELWILHKKMIKISSI